ncbi:MAG: alpha/beta fold hydrolase [Actinomycetota bacterium]|nr:alpha/beta fold hydrolase [Actinomycetota bacterium]
MQSFSRSGLDFDVTDRGPEGPDRGPERAEGAEGSPTVVLLHGFPEDRHSWDQVSERLVTGGLRTLAPDQRGYSPGARPTEPYPEAYAISELVEDVVALLDAAGIDRAHVVGHDWGGAVAWSLAGAHPERVASLTVLSTPHPAALARALRDPWQALHSTYMALFQLPRVPEALLARQLVRWLTSSGLPLASAERYAGRMREPGALRGALGWYRAMRTSRGTVHRTRVPTTFVWGRRDGFLGRRAAEMTGQFVLTDYRFVEVDEGHWLPEVAPDVCAQEILARVRQVAL